jgi:hypothetical protein
MRGGQASVADGAVSPTGHPTIHRSPIVGIPGPLVHPRRRGTFAMQSRGGLPPAGTPGYDRSPGLLTIADDRGGRYPAMSQGQADRNLLFGVLALQMDFISRRPSSRPPARGSWTRPGPGRSCSTRGAVGGACGRCWSPWSRSTCAPTATTPRGACPPSAVGSAVRDDLRRIADPDVQAIPAPSRSAGSTADDPPATRALDGAARGARRGCGFLHCAARPWRLGRGLRGPGPGAPPRGGAEENQDRYADNPGQPRPVTYRSRDQPAPWSTRGSCRSYGLGHYDDGRPFYRHAVRAGATPRQRHRRFHEAEGPRRHRASGAWRCAGSWGGSSTSATRWPSPQNRGVLPPRLEAENIMLGKYGETWSSTGAWPGRRASPAARRCRTQAPVVMSVRGSGVEETPGALCTPSTLVHVSVNLAHKALMGREASFPVIPDARRTASDIVAF